MRSILNLGPTFIKIGQLSSTRADLFPAAFTEELAELQVGGVGSHECMHCGLTACQYC